MSRCLQSSPRLIMPQLIISSGRGRRAKLRRTGNGGSDGNKRPACVPPFSAASADSIDGVLGECTRRSTEKQRFRKSQLLWLTKHHLSTTALPPKNGRFSTRGITGRPANVAPQQPTSTSERPGPRAARSSKKRINDSTKPFIQPRPTSPSGPLLRPAESPSRVHLRRARHTEKEGKRVFFSFEVSADL